MKPDELPPFRDLTVRDCINLSADEINQIIADNYVPAGRILELANDIIKEIYT